MVLLCPHKLLLGFLVCILATMLRFPGGTAVEDSSQLYLYLLLDNVCLES